MCEQETFQNISNDELAKMWSWLEEGIFVFPSTRVEGKSPILPPKLQSWWLDISEMIISLYLTEMKTTKSIYSSSNI